MDRTVEAKVRRAAETHEERAGRAAQARAVLPACSVRPGPAAHLVRRAQPGRTAPKRLALGAQRERDWPGPLVPLLLPPEREQPVGLAEPPPEVLARQASAEPVARDAVQLLEQPEAEVPLIAQRRAAALAAKAESAECVQAAAGQPGGRRRVADGAGTRPQGVPEEAS